LLALCACAVVLHFPADKAWQYSEDEAQRAGFAPHDPDRPPRIKDFLRVKIPPLVAEASSGWDQLQRTIDDAGGWRKFSRHVYEELRGPDLSADWALLEVKEVGVRGVGGVSISTRDEVGCPRQRHRAIRRRDAQRDTDAVDLVNRVFHRVFHRVGGRVIHRVWSLARTSEC
jgi:hypothetical protein